MHHIACLGYNLIGCWMQPYDWLSYAKKPIGWIINNPKQTNQLNQAFLLAAHSLNLIGYKIYQVLGC